MGTNAAEASIYTVMPMLISSVATFREAAICGREVLIMALSSPWRKKALATIKAMSRDSARNEVIRVQRLGDYIPK
jgi:hypothetical protein